MKKSKTKISAYEREKRKELKAFTRQEEARPPRHLESMGSYRASPIFTEAKSLEKQLIEKECLNINCPSCGEKMTEPPIKLFPHLTCISCEIGVSIKVTRIRSYIYEEKMDDFWDISHLSKKAPELTD